MSEQFDDIVRQLGVNGWHAQWRASQLAVAPVVSGAPDVVGIGRHAWSLLPSQDARWAALDALFTAYWQNVLDHDIRNDLDADADLGVKTGPMHEAVALARAANVKTVVVDRDQLAALLSQFDAWHLAKLNDRQADSDTEGGTG